MLHVGSQCLARALTQHENAARKHADRDRAKLLLLTYAAECGLKLALLQKRGVHTTQRLDEDDLTHDLNALLRSLGQAPSFRTVRAVEPKGEDVAPGGLHELLRYGGAFSPSDTDEVRDQLEKAIAWAKEQI